MLKVILRPLPAKETTLRTNRFSPLENALVLACVAAVAVPAYLAFNGPASSSVSLTNVQTAITAADMFARNNGLYTGIDGRRLRRQVPGLDARLLAVAVNGDAGYCLEDSANGRVFHYVGGDPGSALEPGYAPARIGPGPCSAAVGVAAS